MDTDVASWVLEHLLRQSLDDRTLNALLRVLPIPNANFSLKKAMLLRRIQSEIGKASISEKILGLLEYIEELEYQEGVATSDAMKLAYCAVAVDSTLRFLDEKEEENKGYYFATVKRIWRGRVLEMERSKRVVGLLSDELEVWRDEIEAAVWDPSVCENLRVKNRGINGLKAVRAYLHEAWKNMGPTFLEIVAGTVSYDMMREVLGRANRRNCDQIVEDSPQHLIVIDKDKELHRGGVLPRRKHVAIKRSRGATVGTSKGVKITDTEELDLRKSSNDYKCLPTPEVNKVQEALRTSSLELQAVVEDPLPDALRLTKNVTSWMGGENLNQEPSVRGQNGVEVDVTNPSVGMTSAASLAIVAICDDQSSRHQNDVSKPSLMAWNNTARTFEWHNSIDSPEGSADHESRLHLPTPKRRVVSPLKKYQTPKLARRRKVKKWSTLEEDTLRTGVQRFGTGKWKVILNAYRDTFDERTEVDLKDKWRNLTRY